MRKRLVIEVEGVEQTVSEIIRNIEATALGQIGSHELNAHAIQREIVPGKVSDTIQIPGFLNGQHIKGLPETGNRKG